MKQLGKPPGRLIKAPFMAWVNRVIWINSPFLPQ
jgi:hypothetical protein